MDEDETPVIQELSSSLKHLLTLYKNEDVQEPLRKLVTSMFEGLVDKFGYVSRPGESLNDGVCRVVAVSTMYKAKDPKTIQALNDLYVAKTVPADLRNLCFRAAMKTNGKKVYEELLNVYNTSSLAGERKDAMSALASSDDPVLQKRTLKWVLVSGQVRIQDLSNPVSSVAGSMNGGVLVWNWFKKEAFAYYKHLNTSQQTIFKGFVNSSIQGLSTELHISEIREFFKANPVPAAQLKIKQNIETISQRIKRKERELPILRKYFNIN